VTSEDIIPTQANLTTPVRPVQFEDKTGKSRPIVIQKLDRMQELDFTLIAKKGVGRTHAKWSPVATCIMYRHPTVEVHNEKLRGFTNENLKEIEASCPRKVFKVNEVKQ